MQQQPHCNHDKLLCLHCNVVIMQTVLKLVPKKEKSMDITKKPDGKWIMKCKKHGVPYSVFYAKDGYFTKEDAQRRVDEFRETHIMFSPDCSLDAVTEDWNANAE